MNVSLLRVKHLMNASVVVEQDLILNKVLFVHTENNKEYKTTRRQNSAPNHHMFTDTFLSCT